MSGQLDAIIERCLVRFRAWVVLARSVVEAEFPEFEALQSFCVLRLEKNGMDSFNREQGELHLAKLASFLNLDKDALQAEFLDHRPVALHIFNTHSVSQFTAWRMAVESVTKGPRKARKMQAHPVSVLVQLLVRDGAMGASSSGVERLFSLVKGAHGTQRADLDPQTVLDEMTLLSCRGQSVEESLALAARAARVWREVYRTTRLGTEHARHATGAKRQADDTGTLSGWVKRRRRAVSTAVDVLSAHGVLDARAGTEQVVGNSGWTEMHEKELNFQRSKRRLRAIDAMEENALVECELRQEFGSIQSAHLALNEHRAAAQKREANYKQLQRKKQVALASPTLPEMNGKNIFIDAGVRMNKDLLDQSLQKHQLRVCSLREHAGVFLLNDPSKPGQRCLWNAMLGGGVLMSPSFFATGTGPLITYKKAMSTKRVVFITDQFTVDHPRLLAIMTARLRETSCKWRLEVDKGGFLEACSKRAGYGNSCECIAFVSVAEKSAKQEPVIQIHMFTHRLRNRRTGGASH
jgi:hypothetical protein